MGLKLSPMASKLKNFSTTYDPNHGYADSGEKETKGDLVNLPSAKYKEKTGCEHLFAHREEKTIMCPYKGQPREIFPTVCEWHREEADPECVGCKNRILH